MAVVPELHHCVSGDARLLTGVLVMRRVEFQLTMLAGVEPKCESPRRFSLSKSGPAFYQSVAC